jgi:hypothetical protein
MKTLTWSYWGLRPGYGPQGRMAWGNQGLCKVSLEPAMHDHTTPCGRTLYEQLYGVEAYRLSGLRPSYYPLGYPMGMAYAAERFYSP